MKKDLKIKDHFLSKEVFNVVEHVDGVLKTQPDSDEKTLDKYYDSSQYSSHYNVGGFIGFLYSLSAFDSDKDAEVNRIDDPRFTFLRQNFIYLLEEWGSQ